GIEGQKKGVLGNSRAMGSVWKSGTVEEDHHRSGRPQCPILLGHLDALRREPADVLGFRAMDGPALEPAPPAKCGMPAPEVHQATRELELDPVEAAPVVPGRLAVLAVSVVVAALGPSDLVASEQHRHPLRQE